MRSIYCLYTGLETSIIDNDLNARDKILAEGAEIAEAAEGAEA